MASIEKLPSGKFRARVTYKTPTGFRQKSFTADTRKEAVRLAALFKPTKSTGTIGEMVETYIEVKKAVLSPSTVKAYLSMARTIKTRHAALWRLTEVSQAQAQALANEYSPKTARNMIGLLSSAVKFAGGSFPTVTFPRWELRSDFIPREEDIQQILSAVRGTKMELPVLLGMMGLRRSEVVAVTPADLDGNLLHIHEAIVIGIDGPVRKGTKTRLSTRAIILPDEIADLLRKGPVELSINSIGKRFAKVTKDLGLTVRFHDLRHYFASYCHNVLQLPDAAIQKLGGWAPNSSALRRHYVHSMRDDETAQLVAASFSATISATPKKNTLK